MKTNFLPCFQCFYRLVCYRPQGKVMFSQASVILSTIGLMATRSLLILVTARSVRILLECFLVLNRAHQTGWEMTLLRWKDFHGEVVQRETQLVYCYGVNHLKPHYQQAKRYVLMDGNAKHVCTSPIEPLFDQLLSLSSKRCIFTCVPYVDICIDFLADAKK